VRIFPTNPAATAAAGAGPSPSKSSGDLFGLLLASVSQAVSAHSNRDAAAQGAQARPSSDDAESSQASKAPASAQTSSQDPAGAQGTSIATASSPHPSLSPALLAALTQPEFAIPTAAALKPGGDPKTASSSVTKPVKDGEGNSSQKTEAGQSAAASNQQSAATGPVPALMPPSQMSIVAGLGIRGDGAQKAMTGDTANLAVEANANSAKQAPQHATADGSAAIESAAGAQQLPSTGGVQLPQENFALPVIAAPTPTSALPATVSASQSGKESQKASADSQAGNSSDSAVSGQKSDNASSSGTPAAGSATPAAQSGASSAQQANAAHAAGIQAGGPAANAAQPQAPVLHVPAQDGGAPRTNLDGSGAAPRAADARGDTLQHLAETAEPSTGTGIDSARVIQSMNQTEMQVGMRSADFGDISIRASLSQQQMMAQISVNHDELSQAMMAHLSTVQTKIGNDYGLQASISVHNQGSATAGQGGGQSYQQQQHSNPHSSRAINPVELSAPEMMLHPAPAAAVDAGYRLDIQA